MTATFVIGSDPANPHRIAPADWKENGVDYGAWCLCSKCGRLSTSTVTFDFYAEEAGEPLVCEICKLYPA